MLRGGIFMANPKLISIDITLTSPIKKADILKRIKEELDKEFATEVVDQHHRVTVTCDHEHSGSPKSPPKGKK
jgi:hypothetical protein